MTQESHRSIPRRKFLAIGAAVPVFAQLLARVKLSLSAETQAADSSLGFERLPEADLAREVESLLKLVDPKLLHRYTPIDPTKTAWPLWKQAKEAFVPEPSDDEFFEDLEKFSANTANVT